MLCRSSPAPFRMQPPNRTEGAAVRRRARDPRSGGVPLPTGCHILGEMGVANGSSSQLAWPCRRQHRSAGVRRCGGNASGGKALSRKLRAADLVAGRDGSAGRRLLPVARGAQRTRQDWRVWSLPRPIAASVPTSTGGMHALSCQPGRRPLARMYALRGGQRGADVQPLRRNGRPDGRRTCICRAGCRLAILSSLPPAAGQVPGQGAVGPACQWPLRFGQARRCCVFSGKGGDE